MSLSVLSHDITKVSTKAINPPDKYPEFTAEGFVFVNTKLDIHVTSDTPAVLWVFHAFSKVKSPDYLGKQRVQKCIKALK